MKVQVSCMECLAQGRDGAVVHVPVRDTCVYDVTCSNGHDSLIHVQAFKYQLLFESGIEALARGYYREAVSSFAVALERFYEYCVEIFIVGTLSPQDTGLFDQTALENYDKFWRNPLKLSERQLGAFYSLYFNEFGESPVIFDQSFSKKLKYKVVTNPVNFRNRVVHEGYFPSYDESLEYGEAVQEYIILLEDVFSEKDSSMGLPRQFYVTFLEVGLAMLRRGKPQSQLSSISCSTFLGMRNHKDNRLIYNNLFSYITSLKL